jgi:hypothetical protein
MTAKFSLDKDKIKVLLLEESIPTRWRPFGQPATPMWNI